jgi:hypothetical protein
MAQVRFRGRLWPRTRIAQQRRFFSRQSVRRDLKRDRVPLLSGGGFGRCGGRDFARTNREALKSDPVCDGVGVVEERSRADQRRAALNAGMSDVLKIVRSGAISVQRGRDGRDLHPMSAMRAGEEESRQVRWGNVLVMHGALPVVRPPNSAAPTPRPI